jgi:hypothetical protein
VLPGVRDAAANESPGDGWPKLRLLQGVWAGAESASVAREGLVAEPLGLGDTLAQGARAPPFLRGQPARKGR